ncbi:sensor histidine kinase [Mesorhizobium sp. B2-4-12]|uniref:ATP-binding protein n=1 Tax=Mesorhizobium sp. B2-4-12 TaxID=2589937 RepID=UPI0011262CE6|nr:ATP-binding protein [Mesorhizobium sp. B2-4-12]TPK88441.1 sensor histidine kinase [Mesorhizobium sp. B2-4-12]
METNFQRLVEHWPLSPIGGALFPLFEAISNSIHALKEAEIDNPNIEIEIERDTQQATLAGEDFEELAPIVSFRVRDNGVGFTDAHMDAFKEIASSYKERIGLGGKGVGRLAWLKAFESVSVETQYKSEHKFSKRFFKFSLPVGVHDEASLNASTLTTGTDLHLRNSLPKFRDRMPRRLDILAREICRHFMPVLISIGPPKIVLSDGLERLEINISDYSSVDNEAFEVAGIGLMAHHVRIRSPYERSHAISICADGRAVRTRKIEAIPNQRLKDDIGDFYYHCYVTGEYLNKRVTGQRTSIDLPEEPSLIEPLSGRDLDQRVDHLVANHLRPFIEEAREIRASEVEQVISRQYPEYRYLIVGNNDETENIPLGSTANQISDHLAVAHARRLKDGRARLEQTLKKFEQAGDVNPQKVVEEFDAVYLSSIQAHQSSLIGYLLFRRKILELYEQVISKSADRFQKEAAVHSLIFPRHTSVGGNRDFNDNNLWLVDERLTFANFIDSDRDISKHPALFEVSNGNEPDIACYFGFAFSADQEPSDLREVVIVEFKRPGPLLSRDEHPYTQVTRYIREIREGKWADNGKKIKANNSTRFYAYIICDISDKATQTIIEEYQFRPMFGGVEGYFIFNVPLNAYIEFVPFEKIGRDARRRHKAFFDRLTLPTPSGE